MNLGYTLPDAEKDITADPAVKLHTMRDDKHNRWRPGMKIHHHIGRYKKYRCFLVNECVSVQKVLIVYDVKKTLIGLKICVDRRRLRKEEVPVFIRNDGFKSMQQFIDWFFPVHKKKGYRTRTMWAGNLIHWTGLKY